MSDMSRPNTPTDERRVRVVLLAAGAGSRFHDVGHKLTARIPGNGRRDGETVVERSLAAAIAAGIGRPIVITGRLDAHELGIARRTDIDIVHNVDWAAGQMTSVRAGIAQAADENAEAVVIGLADQPGVEAGAWKAVADAALAGAGIAVATYDGRRSNPVALHRDVWDLLPTTGDEGARSLMRVRPDLVSEVPCTGSPKDIDTVEDLTRWQSN